MAPLPLQNPDVPKNRQGGICHFLNLQEDNIRFILLAILLYAYLAIGAFIFQAVEQPVEEKMRRDFQILYNEFVRNFTNCYLNYKIPPSRGTTDSSTGFGFAPEPDTVSISSNTSSYRSDVVRKEAGESGIVISTTVGTNLSSMPVVEPYTVTLDGLHELLFAYGNATQAGVLWKRRRWDWVGSFHFAWTIVSTIGYGATTPATPLGKLLIIPYGFIGCAGGLLFFNLFLERIITFLATCMRMYRMQRQKRRPCVDSYFISETAPSPATASTQNQNLRRGNSPSRSSTGEESTVEAPDWKPSVYWVMLCLFIMSIIVICVSGVIFQHMEGWTFGESVYFSFVSYATIGFGDYVSLQSPSYDFETAYRVVAFVVMVFGCCCIYSLLNVTSIVIKQLLNWIIKRMDYCGDCCCCTYCRCSANKVIRRMSTKRRRGSRSNLRHLRKSGDRCQIAVLRQSTTARALALGHHPYEPPGSPDATTSDGGGIGGSRFDLDERRCSGENMISIRGEYSNKVSLAVMQKRLYETAQMSRHSSSYGAGSGEYSGSNFSATSVGPLAIVTEKLGENPG